MNKYNQYTYKKFRDALKKYQPGVAAILLDVSIPTILRWRIGSTKPHKTMLPGIMKKL